MMFPKRSTKKGPSDEEIQSAKDAVLQDPTNVRALHKLGDVYAKAEQWPQAISTYVQAGEKYEQSGGYPTAIAVYKQALKIDPANASALQRMGEACVALERWADAIEAYKELAASLAHENRREEAVAALEEALIHIEALSKWDECIQVSEQVLALAPTHLGAIRLAAHGALELNDTKRALAFLQQGFRAHKDDDILLEMMAEAFGRLGQYNKSISIYQKLAAAREAAGDVEIACEFYEQILEWEPHHSEASLAIHRLRGRMLPQESELSANDSFIGLDQEEATLAGHDATHDEYTDEFDFIDDDEGDTVTTSWPSPQAGSEAAPAPNDELIVLLYQVEKYLQYNLIAQAEEALHQALDIDPGHPFALQLQADLLARQGKIPNEA